MPCVKSYAILVPGRAKNRIISDTDNLIQFQHFQFYKYAYDPFELTQKSNSLKAHNKLDGIPITLFLICAKKNLMIERNGSNQVNLLSQTLTQRSDFDHTLFAFDHALFAFRIERRKFRRE